MKRFAARRLCGALAALVFSLPLAAGAQPAARAAAEQELATLRERVLATREKLSESDQRERKLLAKLEDLDRRALVLAREVRSAEAEAQMSRNRAADLERQRGIAEQRLAQTRKALSARVVALYKAGELGPVKALFTAETLPELLGRFSALRSVVRYDAELAARYEGERRALAVLADATDAALRERDAAVASLRGSRSELSSERGAKQKLLAALRRDRSESRELLAELEQAARALEATLGALSDDADSGGAAISAGFATRRGTLAPPVDAPVAAPFGRVVDAEFQTATLRTGVEFAARRGESVRAVALGQVRFADWFRGYGKLVIVDHGDDYYSVSGHLEDILVGVGDRVAEGQPIATVGETGSLAGPSLYFEIRRGAEAQDPQGWLR